MTASPDPFQSALQQHRAGNLREAEVQYRQILALNPNHADALHMLGLLASQVGRNDIAAQLLEQALALAPQSAALHAELAEFHRRLDHLDRANALARRAVELDPQLFDAHFNLAVIQQQQKHLDDAVASYRKALALNSCHPQSHYNLANALKAQGHLPDAVDAYYHAIALKPDYTEALGNLGLALYETRNLSAAVTAFNAVLSITPDDPVAHNSLANALRDQGHTEAAIAAYSRAVELQPAYALAHNNLGKLLHDAGRLVDAVPHYRRAIAAAPERSEPYQNLGMALEKLGQKQEAVTMYKAAMERGVALPEARYHMAAVVGIDVPEAAPAAHIVQLFDQFAEKFDQHLVEKLHYQTPQRLHEALLAALPASPPAAHSLDILDLGCGTGLCAPFLKPLARTLLGVDLSPAMIEKARHRNLYDHLFIEDIVAAMNARPDSFDLLLAADVLIYFGDLAPVFAAAARALRPNALFAFSVESYPADGYALCPTRRYAHAESYLRHLAPAHHLNILSLTPATLREEANHPVPGFILIAQKT